MCDNLWGVSKQISPEREEAVALSRSLSSCLVIESRDSQCSSGKNRSTNAEQQENLLPLGMSKHLIGSDSHCRSWSQRHSAPLADPSSFLNQKDEGREVVSSCDASPVISYCFEGSGDSAPLESRFNGSDLQQPVILGEEQVLASGWWNGEKKDVSDLGQQKDNVLKLGQQTGEKGDSPDSQQNGEKGDFPDLCQQNGEKGHLDLVLSASEGQDSGCVELQADVQGTGNLTCNTSSTCVQAEGNPKVTPMSNFKRTKAKKRTHCFPGDSKPEEFPPRKKLKGKYIISKSRAKIKCYRWKEKMRFLIRERKRFKASSCEVGVCKCVLKEESPEGFWNLYKDHFAWFEKIRNCRIPRLTYKKFVDLVLAESSAALAFSKCISDSDDELPLGVLYESLPEDVDGKDEVWLAHNLLLSPLYTEGKKACWRKVHLSDVSKEEPHWHGILYLRKLMARLSSSQEIARKIVKFFMSPWKQSPRQIMGKICKSLEIPFCWEIEQLVSCIMQDLHNKGLIPCDMCLSKMEASNKIVKTSSRRSVLPLSRIPKKNLKARNAGLPDQPSSSEDHITSAELITAEVPTATETVNCLVVEPLKNVEATLESAPETPERATSPLAALSRWWVSSTKNLKDAESTSVASHEASSQQTSTRKGSSHESLKEVRLSSREGKSHKILKEEFLPHNIFGSLVTALNHKEGGAMSASPNLKESRKPPKKGAAKSASPNLEKSAKPPKKGAAMNASPAPKNSTKSPKPKKQKQSTPVKTSIKHLRTEIMEPMLRGWIRELVNRRVSDNVRADVYYHPPVGRKLRSMVEVGRYLTEHNITDLTLANFSYSKTPIGCGPPREIIRNANANYCFKKIEESKGKVKVKKEEKYKSPKKKKKESTKEKKPKKKKSTVTQQKQHGSAVDRKNVKGSTDEAPSMNDSWSDEMPITNEIGETTGFEDWIDKGEAAKDSVKTAKDSPEIDKDQAAKEPPEKNILEPGVSRSLFKNPCCLTGKVPQKATRHVVKSMLKCSWLGIVEQYERRKIIKDRWRSFESLRIGNSAEVPSALVGQSTKIGFAEPIGPSVSHIQSVGPSFTATQPDKMSDSLMEPSSGASMGRIRVKNLTELIDGTGSSSPPVGTVFQSTQHTVGQGAAPSTVGNTNATDNISYVTSSRSSFFNTAQSSTTQKPHLSKDHSLQMQSLANIQGMNTQNGAGGVKLIFPLIPQNQRALHILQLKSQNKDSGTVSIPLEKVTPTTSNLGIVDMQKMKDLRDSTPVGGLKHVGSLQRVLTKSLPVTGIPQVKIPVTQPSVSVDELTHVGTVQRVSTTSPPVTGVTDIPMVNISTAQPSVPVTDTNQVVVTMTQSSLPVNSSSLVTSSVGQPVSDSSQNPRLSEQPAMNSISEGGTRNNQLSTSNINIGFYRER